MKKSITGSLLACSLALVSASGYAEHNVRPNILLILADDLGYADVGFNGSRDIKTTELDQLAASGTVFSSAYVVHSFCGPSRMGLLTGRYPYEYGGPFNLPPHSSGDYREQGVSPSETMISTVLKDAGYHTGIMGKWHLGQQPIYHPNNRGFDEFYGFQGGGILYFGPYEANNAAGSVWDYKIHPEHNGVSDTSLTKDDYMTDVLTSKGVQFINQAADRKDPFFLFMAYNAPHTVLAAKEEDMAHYPQLTGDRKIYAGMVHALDRGVGELVTALKDKGLYENTLIVFLSDNGGRTDQGANNAPLQGVKGDTFEGGYRTPMFFHWPGKVKAGQTYNYPISALDFYPTFAHLAGAPIPKGKDLDGKDIWADVLAQRNPRKDEMIYTLRHRNNQTEYGARQNQWKIVRAKGKWRLYNLDKDISEKKDLSAKHPDLLRKMVAQLEDMTRNNTQPLWFDSKEAEEKWHKDNMPNRNKSFSIN